VILSLWKLRKALKEICPPSKKNGKGLLYTVTVSFNKMMITVKSVLQVSAYSGLCGMKRFTLPPVRNFSPS